LFDYAASYQANYHESIGACIPTQWKSSYKPQNIPHTDHGTKMKHMNNVAFSMFPVIAVIA